MPAKTTQPSEDVNNPYGYSELDWAAQLDPASPQYSLAAAEMMIDQCHLDQADDFLRARGPAFEHVAGVRQTLGHIAMMRGEHEAAAAFFNEARLLAPDDKAILEDLVRAQVAIGQYAQAEFNLTRLLGPTAA